MDAAVLAHAALLALDVAPGMKPGIYTDMPAADYHADPCAAPSLSASIAKILVGQSPLHAWHAHPRLNPDYEPEESAQFDLGSAAHALLLEGDDRMQVIDAPDYRKKEAQEARDAAREAGKHPVLLKQYADVAEMVRLAQEALYECSDLGNLSLKDGSPEPTLIWQERGVWCRARLDFLPNDRSVILDYKTTTDSTPAAFSRQISRMGYHVQAAFYERGLQKVLEVEAPFVLMAQEVNRPFAVSFHGCAPTLMEIARAMVSDAIRVWGACLEADKWPGHSRRIHWAEAAAWQLTEHEERVAAGIPYDPAILFGGMK